MPFKIIHNDITKVWVDAIVNPINIFSSENGELNKAIHTVAGTELVDEYRMLGNFNIGEVKITKGYELPAKYIIHVVEPEWEDVKEVDTLLANCYKNSLELARSHNIESIAFPIILSRNSNYPRDKALKIAVSVIESFLLSNEMNIFLVVYDKKSFVLPNTLISEVKKYIKDRYLLESIPIFAGMIGGATFASIPQFNIKDILSGLDETFSQMLLRLIDKKGMKDSEVYKKANIDRKLFSKIRNNKNYSPKKQTVIAFAIALELDLKETDKLLRSAGFALSNSNSFDLIIKYFIEKKNYNIFQINEVLFELEQKLLAI